MPRPTLKVYKKRKSVDSRVPRFSYHKETSESQVEVDVSLPSFSEPRPSVSEPSPMSTVMSYEKKCRKQAALAKRRLEDEQEEAEDPDNPSYAPRHY